MRSIGPPTVAKAIAAFERTIVSATAPFDRSGMTFNLTQAPGESSSQVFNAEGTAEVRCAFHTKMKMTIVVKK